MPSTYKALLMMLGGTVCTSRPGRTGSQPALVLAAALTALVVVTFLGGGDTAPPSGCLNSVSDWQVQLAAVCLRQIAPSTQQLPQTASLPHRLVPPHLLFSATVFAPVQVSRDLVGLHCQ